MKLGIFGGTFNPVHRGHLRMAEYFYKALSLDKVLLIPTHLPPHKEAEGLAHGVDRLNMCRLAAREYPFLEPSDIELRREGLSRTADTLDQLRQEYPEAELYLLMGSDMLLSFEKWYHYDKILKTAALCCAPRYPEERAALERQKAILEGQGGRVVLGELEVMTVSSTELREKISLSGDTGEYLTDFVKRYCRTLRLYGEEKPLIAGYRRIVAEMETPGRAFHSFCVSREAVRLAVIYGGDGEKAEIAGLLHDILKDMESGEILQLAGDSAIILKDMLRVFPNIWHGVVGAEYLKDRLHVTDDDILNAVRYHTTARGGMSLLEKLVYLADFTSYDRDYPDVGTMRAKVEESLESGMIYALSYSIVSLVKGGRPILQDSYDAYNEYVYSPTD